MGTCNRVGARLEDKRFLILAALLSLACVGIPRAYGDVFEIVEREGAWRYLPGTAEPSGQDLAAWRLLDFDDAAWATGNAVFGFGNRPPYGTDLSLLDPPMRGNYSSLYLRKTFDVRDVSRIGDLQLRVNYDDAILIWINGQEIARFNTEQETGHVPFDALASRSLISGNNEEIPLDPVGLLQTGTNVVAVQVINSRISNSDLRFALELTDVASPDFRSPEVSLIIPAPNAIVRRLDRLQVSFDEPVLGVDSDDLVIGGQPAASVTGTGAGPYIFSFNEPAAGPVAIAWSESAAITDAAVDRNPFAGGAWTVELDPTAPAPDVIISEFMAANGRTLRDEDGDDPDWVELWNRGEHAADLSGWSLTDAIDEPGRFVFPGGTRLDPDERLIVFASRKNRAESGAELHAPFSLSNEGEFLGLFNGELPRLLVSSFAPAYPPQRFDRSFGLHSSGREGYFGTPTPGEPNAEELFDGFAVEPRFSVERGFFEESFDLELSIRSDHRILYTTDGSDPSGETGEPYSGPIRIASEPGKGTVFVRAVGIADGLLPSASVTHSYLFAEEILSQPQNPEGFPNRWGSQRADYELNPAIIDSDPEMALDGLTSIPTISIVTDVDSLFDLGRGVYSNPSRSGPAFERTVSAELIHTDGRKGFQINCGLRTQGGSSTSGWKSRKVSLRLLFKGQHGPTELQHPLYPDYPVRRFNTLVLDAGLNLTLNHPGHDQRIRTQNIRDQFVADMQNEGGGFAPRSMFVNLYLNGLHWGMYGMHERPDSFWAAENFGGEPEEYDAMRHQSSNVVDGSAAMYNAAIGLANMDLTDDANYELVRQAIDLDDFMNYMLVNIYCGNTDWAHQNWYATLSKDGSVPLRYHSWDAEHVLKGVNDNVITKNDAGGPTGVLSRLRRNLEFRREFADKVHEDFFNGGQFYVDPESPDWDPRAPENNRPASYYMRRVREVESAILLEYARWGDNYFLRGYTRADWLRELDFLISRYFPQRSGRVLQQLRVANLYPDTPAPVFSQHGGEVDPGAAITMSLPPETLPPESVTIYYTLDGTDPRVPFTGAVSPGAIAYAGPVAIDSDGPLQARTLASNEAGEPLWSALNKAHFQILSSGPPLVVVSEIMYHPQPSETRDASEFEFIEIHNPGGTALDLSGAQLSGAVRFTFPPESLLEAGEYGVVVSNPEAFTERYGAADADGPRVLGLFMGQLDNGGERMSVEAEDGQLIVSLRFGDESFWPLGADGLGHSLVPRFPLADDLDLSDPRNWRHSAERGGSPGAADAEPRHGDLLINEIDTAAGGGLELFNTGEATVDLGGWFLGDGRDAETSLKRHRLSGGSVPPGGYHVIEASVFREDLPLNPLGGWLYLSSATAEELTGHVVGARYGAFEVGQVFGLHETSSELEFVALESATPGAINAPPVVPRVAINEIHYHPHTDALLGGDTEFLELHNTGSEAIDISGWTVTGLTDGDSGPFVFPNGSTIPADGFLVLVRVDPEHYRELYPMPDAVVVGPYGGALRNAGEELVLSRPIEGNEAFAVVDRVVYDDTFPWPTSADGDGPSLERIAPDLYGNEVLHWEASLTDGGSPGEANTTRLEATAGQQVPGDLNQDGRLNLVDVIDLLRHLTGHEPFRLPCGSGVLADAGNQKLLDANGDASVDLSDAVQLLNFQFQRGAPHASGTGCRTIASCPEVCAP